MIVLNDNQILLSNVISTKQFKLYNEIILVLGHDKLIFCLTVAHTSIFNPPHQTFFLENQCMKPFFLSFYKGLTSSNYFYIFLFDSSFSLFLHLFINLDLHLSV